MAFTIDHHEMFGYPRARWVEGHFVGRRQIMVKNWSERWEFLKELNQAVNLPYPYSDGPTDALARAAAVKGFGWVARDQDGPFPRLALYEKAVVTVDYSTRGPVLIAGQLVSERIEHSTTHKAFDTSGLRWESADSDIRVNVGEVTRFDAGLDYVLRYHQTLGMPLWLFITPGTVNSNTVGCLTLPFSFAPYTVRYRGCVIERSAGLGMLPAFDIIVRCSIAPGTWRKFWRPQTGQYETIYIAGGGEYRNYPEGPF